MFVRSCQARIEDALGRFSAVGVLGARQIGKTTTALAIAAHRPSLYLDLEDPDDLAKLTDSKSYLAAHADKLIVLDEIQRKPEIFPLLRSLIDANRRAGKRAGQFLILGSASVDLLRQSSESLAGRITYVEMSALSATEIESTAFSLDALWLRGGFPDSFLADSDPHSLEWRLALQTSYLERDIPFWNPRLPSTTLRRLWTMLAHGQGTLFNASKLASNLSVSSQAVGRYVDLLVDLFLVRRLHPWHRNTKKRLVRSPKLYVRDSGMTHALLGIFDHEALLSHSVVGASWEGFVIDNILSVLPLGSESFFYRTSAGAEIDLVITQPGGNISAIEIKRASAPTISRGFHEACNDIGATHRYVVYNGVETFSLRDNVSAIGLSELMRRLGAEG